mmetsp:Transcript_103795/g.201161  ORF Transcript_103795/g.201161 Transcript_103795/m.201161 type:complete len:219 (-) Transcript_103795:412-1068(-)
MFPYLSQSMPAFSTSRSATLGSRPIAARYASTLSKHVVPGGLLLPPGAPRLSCTGFVKSGTSKLTTSQFFSTRMPLLTRSLMRVAATSISMPVRTSALIGEGERIRRLTSAPSLRNIFANSIATTPEPVIATEHGRNPSKLIVSESRMRLPSNGMPGGWNGLDPVARSTFDACTFLARAPMPLLNRKDLPENLAQPHNTTTPAAFSSSRLLRAFAAAS